MTATTSENSGPLWPTASRKRRVLAAYLDYLLLGAPWAVLVWTLAYSIPAMERLSFPLQVLCFIALEIALLTLVKWAPGQYALGIVAYRRSPFASPEDPATVKPSFLVDPGILANERWWTVLFGVLAVLSGAKSIVRWTMWHSPMPFMGVELSYGPSVALQVGLGCIEVAIGIGVLRMRQFAVPLGVAAYGLTLISTVASWRLLPSWIEQYTIARRAYEGRPIRPEEIEFMQLFVPVGTVVLGVFSTCWLLLIYRRIRQARSA